LKNNEARAVRRDTGAAQQLSLSQLDASVQTLLNDIQESMFQKAKAERDSRLIRLETWDNFVSTLDKKCLILAPWCERVECEEAVKERSARSSDDTDEKAPSMGAKTLCIPFKQPTENPLVPGKTRCFACEFKAKSYTLWGRSY
jgi:prolyl-tRNA synthetase